MQDVTSLDQLDRDTRVGVSILCEVRQGMRPWKAARLDDLSPGGFRIAWLSDTRDDMPLRIRIPGLQMLGARICWVRGTTVGCEFVEPLHPAVFEHIARAAAN
ncbi:PilZ domain-containing protein [Novosphingobium sp. PhB165]|uniref:PilZ domain-containing protein n=1 Tax=Novosphingobium sp. PhB165 TaxID=2485105 RepID=UPI0010EDAD7F|nr:PilZ domain-containing protein [Novosphingobium sp. PhB165]TCM22081.1 PilZ domain-containing protein [Novosphingobium sp. PhB165]